MNKLARSIFFVVLVVLAAAGPVAALTQKVPPEREGRGPIHNAVPASVIASEQADPFKVILVDKSLQRLFLYQYDGAGGSKLIRSFACSTGRVEGDKVKEGDRRTPEGIYFFTKVYIDRKLTIFGTRAYHINYPDPYDRADGREGNGIYLHGTNRPLGSRDTNGCVVMDNSDLESLSRHVGIHDTPIIIDRSLNWIGRDQAAELNRRFSGFINNYGPSFSGPIDSAKPNDERRQDLSKAVLLTNHHRAVLWIPVYGQQRLIGWKNVYLPHYPDRPDRLAQVWRPLEPESDRYLASRLGGKEQVISFLRDWVRDWESRNVGRYIRHYSRNFRAYGMNYRKWRSYKARLAKKYGQIDVEIKRIEIKVRGRRAKVTFRQRYVSDKYNDVGKKTLNLIQERGEWKIRRENWRPSPTMEAKR